MSAQRDKAPAYQWYPKDYESDEAVKLMTYEQEGIFRRLLDHQWFHGGLPSDPKLIARLVPKVTPARFLKLWVGIADKFPIVGDRRINGRLERQRGELDAYLKAKSVSGRSAVSVACNHSLSRGVSGEASVTNGSIDAGARLPS